MKNITQSVLSEQLPSATNSARFVSLEGEDRHSSSGRETILKSYLPSLDQQSLCLLTNTHAVQGQSIFKLFQGQKKQEELKPSFLDQMAVFTSLYLMFIF